ncbi:SDR family NAD(P)-dependent oxidoreductase [Streptomyces hainanensis]|uniref:SDR family oxidoreductase n=1 Tax=Streptomyces hainanensis TaxID=402648 RepID=A0A4R4TQK9_9ACTN|nr:SDR family oxidoreductase [Streptomyces hainanensis]TDC80497.1 SDR family oxidoreductase [Streptomyces hainanensis]
MVGVSEGPVALVIGGASGIGEATIDELVRQGWRVVVADRDVEGAERVAARINASGAAAHSVAVDVTDTPSVEAATRAAAERWERLDAVIPCAGIIDPSPSDTLEDAALLRMLDIHLVGTVRCVRAAFPYLREAAEPAIVAVSSVAAHIGTPHRLSYTAAKGGIEAVVRTLAVEWAPYGIRINAVAPGWVRTPMIARAIGEGRLDAGTLEKLSPFERFAEPVEVAGAIAFLASPAASYVSGTTLLVDGALTVRGPWPQGVVPPPVRGREN